MAYNKLTKTTATVLLAGAIAVVAGSCRSSAPAATPAPVVAERPTRIDGMVSPAMRQCMIFRMSGDYADNVPVTVDANGQLLSYPAPGDLDENSVPVRLCDGWWLNCSGMSADAVFTRYTYADYTRLSATPTIEQIKAAIIPGARVTQVETIAMPLRQARADTAAVNDIIRERMAVEFRGATDSLVP